MVIRVNIGDRSKTVDKMGSTAGLKSMRAFQKMLILFDSQSFTLAAFVFVLLFGFTLLLDPNLNL